MIENTRIYEIFRRVVREFLHGEKLGVPGTVPGRPGIRETAESQRWLRTTEELFYRDPPPFFITTITSHVRGDIQATRRNAYQRMFGMDLNHGTDDNKPYPYTKAEAANSGFVSTFEELLREVWIGMENVNNQTGANPTDDAKIADLAEKLHDMLRTRREAGNLSREEFDFVSMMSWFHLTVDSDLPIIQDLRAQAASPEERLFKIAERVGLPAHGLSKNYFDIADSISRDPHRDRNRHFQHPPRSACALHAHRWRRSRGSDADHHPALVHHHGARDESAESDSELIGGRREASHDPFPMDRPVPSAEPCRMSQADEGFAFSAPGVPGEAEGAWSRRRGGRRLRRLDGGPAACPTRHQSDGVRSTQGSGRTRVEQPEFQ